MPLEATPIRNRLLNALPPQDLDRLRPHLESLPLRARRVLHHERTPVEYVYFVEEGLVSVLVRTGQNSTVEVWLVGCEGIAGVSAVLGVTQTPYRRLVQVEGSALRIRAETLRRAMDEMPALRDVLFAYVHVVLLQTAQSGACGLRHSLQQRLARWLLTARDRLGREELPLTHDMLGKMLGVRRASVTQALSGLIEAGAVTTSRGCINIVDGDRLGEASCDCYRTIRLEYERVFARHVQPAPIRERAFVARRAAGA